MGLLIRLFAGAVGDRFAPVLAYALVIALLVGGFMWLRADAYSDGEAANEARWQAASAKLEVEAARAEGAANVAAAEREAEYLDQLNDEKERLHEAEVTGGSALDVLFGS